MTDLETLRGLCLLLSDPDALVALRGSGLASLRIGELELRFAPSAPPSPSAGTQREDYDTDAAPATERKPDAAADDDERSALELLLHSGGGDIDRLLSMQRKGRNAA